MKTIKTFSFLLLLFLLVVSLGCNQNTSNKKKNSGIEGQVLLSPTSPMVSSDRPRTDRPYKAKLKILNQDREEILQIDTDDKGKFKISLEPGEYIISPVAPNAVELPDSSKLPLPPKPPYPEEQKVTVKSNEYTVVTVVFDTSIR
jgi:hypothetical protein